MHTLICGVTMSGKTTMARELSRAYLRARQNVIVRDPMGTETAGGDWGDGAIIFGPTQDEEFWSYLRHPDVKNTHVIIDEAADFFAVNQPENQWLLRGGRHFGFQVTLLAQRPKMLAPNVRAQCGMGYLFRLGKEDMREILADFGHSASDAEFSEPLDTGDFYMVKAGAAAIVRGNVFSLLNSNRRHIK